MSKIIIDICYLSSLSIDNFFSITCIMITYNYNISNFDNGYDPIQLIHEIKTSNIQTMNIISVNGDEATNIMSIIFESRLSPEDKIELDNIVDSHIPISQTDQKINVDIDMMNHIIKNLRLGTSDTDAVNKGYVDNAISAINIDSLDLGFLKDHVDNTSNPHQVTKQQIGLGNVNNIKHNLNSNTKPGKLDDIISGYTIGSTWLNSITEKAYLCVDSREMNAVWTEITSLGEKIEIHNLGSGESVFSNKVDANVYLKSIQGSNNVDVESDNSTIYIKSKDSHSFLLSPITIEVMDSSYKTDLLCFPWMNSEYLTYRNGHIIFDASIPATNQLSIRVINKTENSVLGELSDISTSGMYKLSIANPPADARIYIQVKKYDPNEPNPKIYGIVLRYES